MMNYMIMVKRMRNSFKYYFKSGCSSCDFILKHLDLNKNDEVIVPVTLCQSIIDVIINNDLKPIFVDIDDNFLMTKDSIKEKITNKTKAIIFVEQYGNNISDDFDYFNKDNERIIKILDSCQNGIKKYDNNFDYIFYSFNKRKPIDLNGYSLLESKNSLDINNNISKLILFKLFIKRLFYKIRLYRKRKIRNIILNNIKIPGKLLECSNYSYHRIVYVMNVTKKEFNIIDDKIYDFMSKNNLDTLQTTIEEAPFEKLNVKEDFKMYNKLRYKALYFRSDNRIKNYHMVINELNKIWSDIHE